ncbi:hypothetical protein HOC13_04610 [Candidatus Woesearchaeota archaeon]|jgi:hypothetical protein|nr:hypothetical protein [Candidatus Woesearchaeota archaeon]
MKQVPKSLRVWFLIHFVVDIIVAIPLIFFTKYTLSLFGFPLENLVFARLVGAALIGIGMTSYFCKKKEHFEIMLILKIFWSLAAIVALIWGIIETKLPALWVFLIIFIIFSTVWHFYQMREVSSH